MQNLEAQSKPNWRAIAVFYFLACLWSWPFFWWRLVGFTTGVDVYAEGFFFGRGGGGGAYLNITTNAGCNQHR